MHSHLCGSWSTGIQNLLLDLNVSLDLDSGLKEYRHKLYTVVSWTPLTPQYSRAWQSSQTTDFHQRHQNKSHEEIMDITGMTKCTVTKVTTGLQAYHPRPEVGTRNYFFESAIAIPQLEGSTSTIAIPQLQDRNLRVSIPKFSEYFCPWSGLKN